ncbi:MAG: HRDC domain-containing protein [Geobacteraceae bacterium]|nr:HRDC domain-containing protein [Geobacteraceae bacterium]
MVSDGKGAMGSHGTKRPVMVDSPAGLTKLARRIEGAPVIAFDLEADSLHHYREKVCLVQIAVSRDVFLVDPLAVPDLSPLGGVLADPAVRKVFHGADYDIRSLYRDFSLEVLNLFDTMFACQFLGEKEVGLAAVLKKRFGIELDKRYQKADWSRRPLDDGMIAYAAADTSYLVELYGLLSADLAALGRLSWVEEESELLSQVRAVDREGDPFYIRFKGANRMNPRTLAVLEGLLRFRDGKARISDRPPFKILSNETMRLLAEKKPVKAQDLSGITGLTPRLVERYGTGILKTVQEGCEVPEDRLPTIRRHSRPERDPDREERLKKLKHWREVRAKSLGIDAGVLANNALLENLAQEVPGNMAALDAIPAMRRWQKKEFGAELLASLA